MTFNETNFSFPEENLQLDWVGLNLRCPFQSDPIRILVAYLSSSFDFSISVTELNEYQKVAWMKESSRPSQGEAYLTPWVKPYWNAVILSFRGSNASVFYRLIQESKVNWDFFPDRRLGRLDLCYDRANQSEDPPYDRFFSESCEQYRKQSKRFIANVYQLKAREYMYKIGGRRGARFGRVYRKGNRLRFELECKLDKEKRRNFEDWLFSNSTSKFEMELIKVFYQSWSKWIDLESPYADWLRERIRKLRVQRQAVESLITTYLKPHDFVHENQESQIFTVIQFLSFLASFPETSESPKEFSPYYRLSFPFQKFFDYIGLEGSSYQRKRVLKSLAIVEKPVSFLFADGSFLRYFPVPELFYDNSKKPGILTMTIHSRLYGFRHSFRFPKEFLSETGKVDTKIKLYILQMMTQPTLRKEFWVEGLFESGLYSGLDKIRMRQRILYFLKLLKEKNYVDSEIQIKFKKKESFENMEFHKLTSYQIQKAETLYLTEILSEKESI